MTSIRNFINNHKIRIVECLIVGGIVTAMTVYFNNNPMGVVDVSEEPDLDSQHAQLVREHCISEAEAAFALLVEGDRVGALETAFSVYPDGEKEDIPYTPRAEFALSESLHIYANGNQYYPAMQLEADDDIQFMKVSGDSKLVLAVDDSGMLSVWLAEDGTLLDRFSVVYSDKAGPDQDQFALIGDSRFIYPTVNGFALYDAKSHRVIYEFAGEGANDRCEQVVVEDGEERYLARMRSGYYLMRTDTGEILCHVPISEEDYRVENDDYIIFCGADRFAVATDESQKELRIYSAEDGSLLQTYPLNGGSIQSMRYWKPFINDIVYVVEQGEETDMVYAVDILAEEIRWTYKVSGGGIKGIYPADSDEPTGSSYVVCVGSDTCDALRHWNGSLEKRFRYNSAIIWIDSIGKENAFSVFTEDGTGYYLSLNTKENVRRVDLRYTPEDVKMFGEGYDFVATLPEHSRKITIHRKPVGSKAEIFRETYGRYDNGTIDHTGQYLAMTGISSYMEGSGENQFYVEMLDTTSGDKLWGYIGEGNLLDMIFYSEEEALVLIMDTNICVLDQYTGRKLADYTYLSGEGSLYDGIVDPDDYIGTDDSGRYVFVTHYDTMLGYDLRDGSVKYKVKDSDIGYSEAVCAVSPSMEYFALVGHFSGCVKLFRLSDCQVEGEVTLAYSSGIFEKDDKALFTFEGIWTRGLKSLFFNDRSLEADDFEFYAEFRDGTMQVYSVQAGMDALEKSEEEGHALYPRAMIKPIRSYRGVDIQLARYIHSDGKEYAIAADDSRAYMLIDEAGAEETAEDDFGQITAYIDGFCALDSTRDLLYMIGSDGKCIYRVPIYDADMLAAEAAEALEVD